MSNGQSRIGKDRFLDRTLSDSKFQLTMQAEMGRVWTDNDSTKEKVESLKKKVGEADKDHQDLLRKVDVMQDKMKLLEKFVYSLITACGGLLLKLLYDFIK